MNGRQAIVIAVDGLRAAALGAYGNTCHATPALDALASESVVVDWMYRQSPDLAGFYQSAWGEGSLVRGIADAGAGTTLVTDDADVAEWGNAAAIADVWRVERGALESADDVGETALAHVFAAAFEQLAQANQAAPGAGRLFWIHARGFHGAWDAPLVLREVLLDEDDPDAPTFIAPPASEATDDHDALLAFRAAYAAQTIVLDECLGGLLAAVRELCGEQETLLVVVGCRGFALGEHGVVGAAGASLYGEVLHVPCLLRASGAAPAPPRWSQLATPADLRATLAAWFGMEAPADLPRGVNLLSVEAPIRQHVVAAGAEGERAIRTSEWYLRKPPHGDAEPSGDIELYVKPDDRWEANEIADRQAEDAERLLAALDCIADALETDPFEPVAKLHEDGGARPDP